MSSSQYDIIVFGATGFVGEILCQYLHEHLAGSNTRWAAAGRSHEKLQKLCDRLGRDSAPPIIITDIADETSLEKLCRSTSVVVSTIGPYALHGEPLVKACAETGTDYCDLSGEVQWIRKMINRYSTRAEQTGARIVHCCGFDSIPSDLGVYCLQQQAQKRYGSPCTEVRMRVRRMKGGASGGTVASMANVAREAARDPAVRRELTDPYSLCPPDHSLGAPQREVSVEYDTASSSWVGPFVMAAVNTRIVHRSNALSGNRYGPGFRYQEGMLTGDGRKGRTRARRLAIGLKLFMLGMALAPGRWVLLRFLPQPGEGPTAQEQQSGFFDLVFDGHLSSGEHVRLNVYGKRDPGYGATARMLAQAALCLAQDTPKAEFAGGFWTPATLFGERLVTRLEQHAGLRFEAPQA